MFKRFLVFSSGAATAPNEFINGNGGALDAAERVEPAQPARTPELPATAVPAAKPTPPLRFPAFEEIYNSASARPPVMIWGIQKVADMLTSPHLQGMSQDAKRASLMMALEAAGVRIEDLLQDAMLRQRALNEFDEAQDAKEQAFEEAKEAENRAIQAEIERITAHYMARIQANIDEVASRQDHLRNWQKRKQQEAQRIAAAAALCVPKNGDATTGSYTAVLARCGVEGSANGVR